MGWYVIILVSFPGLCTEMTLWTLSSSHPPKFLLQTGDVQISRMLPAMYIESSLVPSPLRGLGMRLDAQYQIIMDGRSLVARFLCPPPYSGLGTKLGQLPTVYVDC